MTLELNEEIAGASKDDHLAQVRATLGSDGPPEVQAGLSRPAIPPEGAWVWQSFWALKRGVGAISFCEIQAYQESIGVPFEPWEVTAVIQMDGAMERWRGNRARDQ